jgi:hypothetical protein
MPQPDWNRKYVIGKGSHRRPEDNQKFRDGHDRIFGKPSVTCRDCKFLDWISDFCDYPNERHRCAVTDRSNPPCEGERYEFDECA